MADVLLSNWRALVRIFACRHWNLINKPRRMDRQLLNAFEADRIVQRNRAVRLQKLLLHPDLASGRVRGKNLHCYFFPGQMRPARLSVNMPRPSHSTATAAKGALLFKQNCASATVIGEGNEIGAQPRLWSSQTERDVAGSHSRPESEPSKPRYPSATMSLQKTGGTS
jgi:hypothetical protein